MSARKPRPWIKYANRGRPRTPYTRAHRKAALRLRLMLRGSQQSRNVLTSIARLFGFRP